MDTNVLEWDIIRKMIQLKRKYLALYIGFFELLLPL